MTCPEYKKEGIESDRFLEDLVRKCAERWIKDEYGKNYHKPCVKYKVSCLPEKER